MWYYFCVICDRAVTVPLFANFSTLVLSLKHAVELNKQISCSLQLTNKTDEQIAFKVNKSSSPNVFERTLQKRCIWDLIREALGLQVKTTSPRKYCVRPNNGIVPPRSTADVLGNFVNHMIQSVVYLENGCFSFNIIYTP